MGEDHDLPGLPEVVQDLREAVDLGGVHGLHGVVDDDESEGTVRRGGARQEEREREGVQFALAHDAESGCLRAVDGHVHHQLAHSGLLAAGQAYGAQVHVALLAQLLPDLLRVVLERPQPFLAQLGTRLLEPLTGGPDLAQPRPCRRTRAGPGRASLRGG